MKCKKEGCEKDAAPGQVYCSKEHAPLSHLMGRAPRMPATELKPGTYFALSGSATLSERGPHMPSEKTIAKYGSKVLGELSEASGNAGSAQPRSIAEQSKVLSIESSMPQKSAPTTPSTERPVEAESASSGGCSQNRSAVSKTPSGSNVNAVATRLSDSLSPSETIEQETLSSMSLIDESAKQLHGLMKSAGAEIEISKRANKSLNPALVNSVANCASQLQKLIRLKLDVFREWRRT